MVLAAGEWASVSPLWPRASTATHFGRCGGSTTVSKPARLALPTPDIDAGLSPPSTRQPWAPVAPFQLAKTSSPSPSAFGGQAGGSLAVADQGKRKAGKTGRLGLPSGRRGKLFRRAELGEVGLSGPTNEGSPAGQQLHVTEGARGDRRGWVDVLELQLGVFFGLVYVKDNERDRCWLR